MQERLQEDCCKLVVYEAALRNKLHLEHGHSIDTVTATVQLQLRQQLPSRLEHRGRDERRCPQ